MLLNKALVLGRYFQNYYLCGMNPIVLTVLGLLFVGNDSHAKELPVGKGIARRLSMLLCSEEPHSSVMTVCSIYHIMIRKVT